MLLTNNFKNRCGKSIFLCVFISGVALTFGASNASAEALSLNEAVIVVPDRLSTPESNAVDMLRDEVFKRTRIRLAVATAWPRDKPVIAVGRSSGLRKVVGKWPEALTASPAGGAEESYRIETSIRNGQHAIFVVGSDNRGVLYGVGRLLRELRMTRDQVMLEGDLKIETSPAIPIRGHQLGYRPKVNSYDGWTVSMYEQYFRDLIVFGTNAVEFVPPRTDDAQDSPHFPLPKLEMNVRLSQLAEDYGLEFWMWFPALKKDYSNESVVEAVLSGGAEQVPDDIDYSNPANVEREIEKWAEVFAALPHLDKVFVPGGDPGHTRPDILFDFLEKQTKNLHKYHPEAEMWMSPQSFSAEWMEIFKNEIQDKDNNWLSGIVYGPQSRVTLRELREMVPDRYPIRRYPDITHNLESQYVVPDWDLAYAVTEHRESINPRPEDMKYIFHFYEDIMREYGFISYSEGINDDVNKFIWSGLGWDPDQEPIDILREYARYFIGPEFEESFAQALLALEQNWRGPLLTRDGVNTTLKQIRDLEKMAGPKQLQNWRFQQVLFRAYYDAYQRRRYQYETDLEQKAYEALRMAGEIGPEKAMKLAETILDKAITDPVAPDWRERIYTLAEALYNSIKAQLSVPRYQAVSIRRGAHLDRIHYPLNNRLWLQERFDSIAGKSNREVQMREIEAILNWENPGPGGFYDDLGNIMNQKHLVRDISWESDPEHISRVRMGFHDDPTHRLSWRRLAETKYDAPLRMHYPNLNAEAQYQVKIIYGGDKSDTKIRLLADEVYTVHPPMVKPEIPTPLTFDIPVKATRDGELTLSWSQTKGRGHSGRGNQINEVWLIMKKPE